MLAFTAYGRRFELELESHNKLLSNLPARQRKALAGYLMLRGKVAGIPASWARITRTPTGDYGAIWDGKDLFTIAPASTVKHALTSVIPSNPTDSFIYRSSDTNSIAGQGYCTVVEPESNKTSSSSVGLSYKALVEELQVSLAATDLRGQIEIALIGDNEFVNANAADPQGAMLARLNLVDEIFSEQVGITVIATELQPISGSADPFNTTVPSTLLEQLAGYRDTTPAIRSRGLAHLLTGTDLDGNTAGIAYRGSLCDPRFGVSLSEAKNGDVTTSALVMAHELGHNFGAPHDGASGACAATTQNYLMAPILNGSSQFSTCSVAEMEPEISAAHCIAPATSFADVSITNSPGTAQGIVDQPFPLTIEVTGTGTLAARNVRIQTTLPASVWLVRNLTPAFFCSVINSTLTCQLGTVQPGESRQINLELGGHLVGSYSGSLSVTSDNDRYAANNTQNILYTIADTTDGSIQFNATEYSGATRIPMDFEMTVQTKGMEPVRNAQATIGFTSTSMSIESITSEVGTCSIIVNTANCVLGSLSPNSTFSIRIRAKAARAENMAVDAGFSADNESITWNNRARVSVFLSPTVDVALTTQPTIPPILLGNSFTTTAVLSSVGTQAVTGLALRVGEGFGIALQSVVPSQGTCTRDNLGYLCQIGTLPAGQSGTLSITARGTEVGSSLYVFTQVDDNGVDDLTGNNSTYTEIDVRRQRDIEIAGPTYAWGYDASPFIATIPVASIGLSAVQNAVFTATVPPPFTVHAASLGGASCQISDRSVTCVAASVAAGYRGNLLLTLESPQTGLFSGTVSVAASNDGFTGNNSVSFNTEVFPYIDTAIELPSPPASVTVGEIFTLQFRIKQNRNAASVYFTANWDTYAELVSYDAPFSFCDTSHDDYFRCDGIVLQPYSSTLVTLNMRAKRRMQLTVRAGAHTQSDHAYSNDEVSFITFADRQGDASIQASGASASAQPGQVFSPPTLTVVASRSIDEATIELDIANDLVARLENVAISGDGSCAFVLANRAQCSLGTVEGGVARNITLQLKANAAGNTMATYKLISPNDTNASNNTGSIEISVTAPVGSTPSPTPTPAPTPPSATGGGGGKIEVPFLFALLMIVLCRRKQFSAYC